MEQIHDTGDTPTDLARQSASAGWSAHIPQELQAWPQWVVWRYGMLRKSGKREKPLYTPATGRPASTTNAATWGTYEEAAKAAYAGGNYEGIGFVFDETDPYCGVDLDGCRNPETGDLAEWAQIIVTQLDTYTEISPSGTGVKLWLRARLSGTQHTAIPHTGAKIEVYDTERYFTVTGRHLPGTPLTIEERQAALDAWYAATFPQTKVRAATRQAATLPAMSDDELIEKALGAANGEAFRRLMDGDISDYGDDDSAADQAQCNHLAFWTRDSEQIDRLFRQSGLFRAEKWDAARGKTTYGQQTIEKALQYVSAQYHPKVRGEECAVHSYPWQERNETPEEREVYLQGLAEQARDRVQAHIEAREQVPLVIALPPGVGKTRTVATLGSDYDLAWIAERHEMAKSVMISHPFRHIRPCNAETCSEHEVHSAIVSLGYNAWPFHKRHACAYFAQHQQEGSAFYQVAHVPTAYPKKHSAAIVDELNLPNWLIDRGVSEGQVRLARKALNPNEVAAHMLFRALDDTFIEAGQTKYRTLYGKELFDTLDRHLLGQLETHIKKLASNEVLMIERPTLPFYDESIPESLEARGPVILPRIVKALWTELPRWRSGRAWNSRLHMTADKLHILEPQRFNLADGESLPLVILDATAHEGLFKRVFGSDIRVERTEEVLPPPRMRHIAVRTGKRYGKMSLTGSKGTKRQRQDDRPSSQDEYVGRVAKELTRNLNKVDPDGTERAAGRVGLITFKECEMALGDCLGIPEGRRGHFWAVRGSNEFEDCTILLVVGTPTPNLDEVVWFARALYWDDDVPIDTTTRQDERGIPRYRDARLQGVVDYLVNAELTQVAHRNRPLRHDGRTVITLCMGDIDYLPITEEYTYMPKLTYSGLTASEARLERDQEKLEQAKAEFVQRGEHITVTALAKAAKVRKKTAGDWLNQQQIQ